MSTYRHKLLMILLSLALAVAPLRGAWAVTMTATDDADSAAGSHCAQMQQDMNKAESTTAMNDQDPVSGHPCKNNCNGGCCDGACMSCVPATAALAHTTLITADAYKVLLHSMASDTFPERTVTPPLRPPARLPG